MKKRNLVLSALAFMFLIAGCSAKDNGRGVVVKGTKDEVIQTLATQTVLGFSRLNLDNFGAKRMSEKSFSDSEIEEIKSVLAQVDVFLDSDSSIEVEEKVSDNEEYKRQLNLAFFDQSISLYFNDVLENEEIEEDEIEKEVFFKGVALFKGVEFKFHFEHEEEIETNEEETETTLTLFNETTKIIVAQENEKEMSENEISYSYKEIVNEKEIIDFELSIETKEKEVKVELNEKEYKFEYVKVESKEYIKVDVEKDEAAKEALFEKSKKENEDGSYSYEYNLVK